MAKSIGEFEGKMVGRYGDRVAYLWKRRQCFRAHVAHIAYPNTPSQKSERDWFVSMVRFASKATSALKLGLRESADQAQMSEGNYFVRQNKPAFHHEEGAVRIDYPSLTIAEGPAADVYFAKPRFEDGEVVVVPFEKNAHLLRPSSDDKVYLYFYNADLAEGFLSAPVLRRSKVVQVRLPQSWSGSEVHIYGFVVDRAGRSSNSTYVGAGRVNCMEENGTFVPVNKGWQDFVNLAEYSQGVPPAALGDKASPAVCREEESSDPPPDVP